LFKKKKKQKTTKTLEEISETTKKKNFENFKKKKLQNFKKKLQKFQKNSLYVLQFVRKNIPPLKYLLYVRCKSILIVITSIHLLGDLS